jgi:hypothetical protein
MFAYQKLNVSIGHTSCYSSAMTAFTTPMDAAHDSNATTARDPSTIAGESMNTAADPGGSR